MQEPGFEVELGYTSPAADAPEVVGERASCWVLFGPFGVGEVAGETEREVERDEAHCGGWDVSIMPCSSEYLSLASMNNSSKVALTKSTRRPPPYPF
jgi:hypothetical protein